MFNPWVRKVPWRRKWQPIPIFLSGKPHGQKNLAGFCPWGHKESDMTEQLPGSPTHTTYIGMHMYCLENFLALIYRPLIPTLLLANLKIEI